MEKYVYGIDLGTTYSCISYIDETGRPTVITNSEGDVVTPSVVDFSDDSKLTVGQIAKENAVLQPDKVVSFVKSLIGKSNYAIEYNGEDISPEEVSSYILRKVTEDASKLMDAEVKDVVVTCPAYFGAAERVATKKAAEIAGLNVIGIVSEPTAAAIYYGCFKEQDEKTVLVYDLGGGTFDVTVIRIDNEKGIQVICSDGDHELGGKNWDDTLIEYLKSEFCSQMNYDDEFDEYALQDLRIKAERAKQQLSSKDEVLVSIEAAGARGRIAITLDVFDKITEVLLNESIEKTDAAIEIAKSKGYSIDEIILVGGSTKMRQVEKKIIESYKMTPKILEPNEAVAKGAALYALGNYEDVFSDDDEAGSEPGDKPVVVGADVTIGSGKKLFENITVATTKSYALKVLDENEEEKCCNMIIKNELMEDGSFSVTKTFGTHHDNMQIAELVVYESDFLDAYFDVDDDLILGTCELSLPGNLPAGSGIEVTFTLTEEGILEVTGKDLTANNEIFAKMQATAGTCISQEKFEEAIVRSKSLIVQ